MRLSYLQMTLSILALCGASTAWAQKTVRINWTAVTGAQSGMFMAQQEGLFRKNGLDVSSFISLPAPAESKPSSRVR